MNQRFTKEEVLTEIAAGNRTYEGLANKFGLTTSSMKTAMNKLEIKLQEEIPSTSAKKPTITTAFTSGDADWQQKFKEIGENNNMKESCIAQYILDGHSREEAYEHFKNVKVNQIKINFKNKKSSNGAKQIDLTSIETAE